jgi:hypothetical protein
MISLHYQNHKVPTAHIISLFSRFIHCHSFFFSLLCSLPLLSNRLTDDQEKKKVGEEKKGKYTGG